VQSTAQIYKKDLELGGLIFNNQHPFLCKRKAAAKMQRLSMIWI
jgi:hypothetical protein